ncbi:MAG: FG-GAP repeat protein [Acidobacteria bacterium]|nr:FG-GAP repeat protein [Acidobacteriota bacterium]
MKSHFTCQRTIAGLATMLLMATLASSQRFPGIIDVADISGPSLVAFGESPGDQLRVLGTGDFNGDGLNDILLGTPSGDGPDNQRINAGNAYILFGTPNGIPPRDFGDPDELRPDVVFFGAETEDSMGTSAATGDINGDGIDDIIIGAPNADGPGNARENAGEVYIFFGSRDLVVGTTRDVAGAFGEGPDITILGEDRNDGLGASEALGDVNHDGSVDLIIGAPGTFGPNNTRAAAGTVYVIFGEPRLRTGGLIDLRDPVAGADMLIHGTDPGDRIGFAVKAGDLNDDRVDDIVFSAPTADGPANLRQDAGEVYVLFGHTNLGNPPMRDLADVFGPGADLTIYGQDSRDTLGASLAIGDVSGDQVKDLVVAAAGTSVAGGADGPGNARLNAGEVTVILGSQTLRFEGTRDIAAQVGRPADLTIFGADAGDQFGFSLTLGKLSGDDIDDLVIGAPGADGAGNQRMNAGEVYVIFGGVRLFDGLPRDIAEQVGPGADLTLLGPVIGANFGTTVAVAEVDNDQFPDLLIGAPFVNGPDNLRPTSGAAFVISEK